MNLVSRTQNILLSPKQEWQVIDDEETSVGALYIGYIIPLAAIGPVASIIGMEIFGISLPSVGTYRVPIGAALRQGIAQYVMALVGVFVLALIIDELAPYFRGQENRYQALKVAAYSSTGVWVVGIVGLIPALSFLWPLGLYSLYLLSLGLPALMKVPQDKAMGYTVVVIICAVGLFLVIGVIVAQLGGGPVIEAADLFPIIVLASSERY
jgi:Yip1-like protein